MKEGALCTESDQPRGSREIETWDIRTYSSIASAMTSFAVKTNALASRADTGAQQVRLIFYNLVWCTHVLGRKLKQKSSYVQQ